MENFYYAYEQYNSTQSSGMLPAQNNNGELITAREVFEKNKNVNVLVLVKDGTAMKAFYRTDFNL